MAKQALTLYTNHFTIVKVHHAWDLRTVQWSAAVLHEYVRNHRIKDHEAHVFINKNRNRSRWVVVWQETPFLILAPTGIKADHEVNMKIAADWATNKIRDELLAEITVLE